MSLTSVTIISPEAANGRNVVALGVTKAFAAAKKTAVFRPAVCRKETFTDVLLEASNSGLSREQSVGVCPKRARTDKEGSRADIVAAYTEAIETAQPEAVVVVGTDKSAINDPSIFAFNADVAADLKSVVLLAVCTSTALRNRSWALSRRRRPSSRMQAARSPACSSPDAKTNRWNLSRRSSQLTRCRCGRYPPLILTRKTP